MSDRKQDRRSTAANSSAVRPRTGSGLGDKRFALGPYSRVIDRGAVGGLIDGRSREGRFLRTYEQALFDHVGGRPSLPSVTSYSAPPAWRCTSN
jgi:hypothetical protein